VIRKRWRVLAATALLALAGCHPPQETVVKEYKLPLDEVLSRVRLRYEHVKTLKGDGSITVESTQQSQSGSFDVDLKKPDSVLVDLHGPLGIHVGTLSLARDRFIFYNRMENTALIGKPDGKTLQAMFHLNMEFDELLDTFTGEFPLGIERDSLSRFTVSDGLYIAVFRDAGRQKEYRIDGDAFFIASYRILSDEGKPLMVATASRPVDAGEIEMPRLVRVVFPGERRSVTIAYDNIVLNAPVDCAFSLPERVEVIHR
jgi:hypothetical protein